MVGDFQGSNVCGWDIAKREVRILGCKIPLKERVRTSEKSAAGARTQDTHVRVAECAGPTTGNRNPRPQESQGALRYTPLRKSLGESVREPKSKETPQFHVVKAGVLERRPLRSRGKDHGVLCRSGRNLRRRTDRDSAGALCQSKARPSVGRWSRAGLFPIAGPQFLSTLSLS